MAKTQWEGKRDLYKQQVLTLIENSFASYESYIPMFQVDTFDHFFPLGWAQLQVFNYLIAMGMAWECAFE